MCVVYHNEHHEIFPRSVLIQNHKLALRVLSHVVHTHGHFICWKLPIVTCTSVQIYVRILFLKIYIFPSCWVRCRENSNLTAGTKWVLARSVHKESREAENHADGFRQWTKEKQIESLGRVYIHIFLLLLCLGNKEDTWFHTSNCVYYLLNVIQ